MHTHPTVLPLLFSNSVLGPFPHRPRFSWLVSRCSTSSIYRVVVRRGGFRALYGWLGDVWERVRAHKLPRAGPPDWRGVGGRLYVEDLLGVLARVPMSVDMLRETASMHGVPPLRCLLCPFLGLCGCLVGWVS